MAEFLNRMFGRAATQWANWRFERSCKQIAATISTVDDDDGVRQEAPLADDEPPEQRAGMAWIAEYLADTLPQLRAQSRLLEPADPALVGAWRRLPAQQRHLLLLYEARGLTCRQLARQLRLSDEEVRNAIIAAIAQLRYELDAIEAASESRLPR